MSSGGSKTKRSGSVPTKARKGPAIALEPKKKRLGVNIATQMQYSRSVQPGIRVSRKEVVSVINCNTIPFALSTSLTPVEALVNPGNPKLFPWLSGVADLYEKYRFTRMTFRLVSANPSTSAGIVYLAFDTDPIDPVPTTMQEMMANQMATTATVWETVDLRLDMARVNSGMDWRYTKARVGDLSREPRTTYIGQLFIGSAGTYGAIFNLEIDYEVEFSVEQLSYTQEQVISSASFSGTSGTSYPNQLVATPGKVGTVQAGSGRVPVMDLATAGTAIGATITAPVGLVDIGTIQSGLFNSVFSGVSATGSTPAAATANAYPDLAFFDAGGQYLSHAASLAGYTGATTTKVTKGSAGGSALTVGGPLNMTLGISVQDMLAAVPTLRYLLPVATSLSGPPTMSGYTMTYTA